MKRGIPVEIVPGVYQIRCVGVYVTAILNGDDVVLVDAGAMRSTPYISKALKSLGYSLDNVRLVVLTHYHPDHSGELAKLVKATSAEVAIHRHEERIINGSEKAPNPFQNPLIAGIVAPILPLLYSRPTRVDYALEDGDILPFTPDTRPSTASMPAPIKSSRRLMRSSGFWSDIEFS